MSDLIPQPQQKPQGDWKTPTYLLGGALGLLVGLISAYLYTRSADENNPDQRPQRVSTADAFKLVLALISLARQISDLAVNPKARSRK